MNSHTKIWLALVPAVALSLLNPAAWADSLKLDAAHTTVGFKIKHLVISTVNGRFNKFEGTGHYDPKTGVVDQLKVKIDAASVDTNEPKRDEHLKSKDFFDVAKFPAIEFVSKSSEPKSGKTTEIKGDLTIHGVTRPVVLSFDFKGTVTDPWGTKRGAFEASGEINRKDFGLLWNKSLDSGGVMIADKLKIEIEGEVLVSE